MKPINLPLFSFGKNKQFNYIETIFLWFFFILRPFWKKIKWILHLITGRSQIERLCEMESIDLAQKTIIFEKLFSESVQLSNQYNLIEKFSQWNPHLMSQEITSIKSMKPKKYLIFFSKIN